MNKDKKTLIEMVMSFILSTLNLKSVLFLLHLCVLLIHVLPDLLLLLGQRKLIPGHGLHPHFLHPRLLHTDVLQLRGVLPLVHDPNWGWSTAPTPSSTQPGTLFSSATGSSPGGKRSLSAAQFDRKRGGWVQHSGKTVDTHTQRTWRMLI